MRDVSKEVIALLDQYGCDINTALKENVRLEYLCALSAQRENLLEWFDFKKDASLLQVGAGYGAMTGLFLKRTAHVTVLDESMEALEVVAARYPGEPRVQCVRDSLPRFARGQMQSGSRGYDYVTLVGTLKESHEEQIRAAKGLLCPGGTLIVAACNSFGMKYIAGAEKEQYNITRNELAQLLSGGSWYYPMPDYRLPSTIYSEKYLPKIGDLTGVLAVYDYPKYLLMDVGAAFDMVCEDGQFENFANSFLVMWKKEE